MCILRTLRRIHRGQGGKIYGKALKINIAATNQKHFVNSKVVICSQIRTYGGIFMFGYVCVGLGIVTGLIGTYLFTRWLGQILPGRKGDRYEKAP